MQLNQGTLFFIAVFGVIASAFLFWYARKTWKLGGSPRTIVVKCKSLLLGLFASLLLFASGLSAFGFYLNYLDSQVPRFPLNDYFARVREDNPEWIRVHGHDVITDAVFYRAMDVNGSSVYIFVRKGDEHKPLKDVKDMLVVTPVTKEAAAVINKAVVMSGSVIRLSGSVREVMLNDNGVVTVHLEAAQAGKEL